MLAHKLQSRLYICAVHSNARCGTGGTYSDLLLLAFIICFRLFFYVFYISICAHRTLRLVIEFKQIIFVLIRTLIFSRRCLRVRLFAHYEAIRIGKFVVFLFYLSFRLNYVLTFLAALLDCFYSIFFFCISTCLHRSF